MIDLKIDWNPILTIVLQGLLSFLATALTTYFLMLTRAEWVKLQASQPDLVDKIQDAAEWARSAVEQLRKNGQLPSPTEAKEYAEALVDKYLKAKGIDVDLTPFYEVISASIEAAIDNNKKTIASTTVTKVEASPSKVVSPVKNYTAAAKVAEVPSVVTTTTSSTVSTSGDSVPVVPVVENGDVVKNDGSVG